MSECAEATGLKLWGNTCVSAPTVGPHAPYAAELAKHEVSANFRIEGHATYLGFEVVPGAFQHQWTAVVAKAEEPGVRCPVSAQRGCLCIVVQYPHRTANDGQGSAGDADERRSAGNDARLAESSQGAFAGSAVALALQRSIFGLLVEAHDVVVRARAVSCRARSAQIQLVVADRIAAPTARRCGD